MKKNTKEETEELKGDSEHWGSINIKEPIAGMK